MRDRADIERLLATTPLLSELLREVSALGLPQGFIAAGMVRNAVWDVLHARAPSLHPRSDVDVIYFDLDRCERQHDRQIEAALRARRPDILWQVKNQARTHLRNGDPPYRDVRAALRIYPETATAIAARLQDGRVEIEAPLGISDLLALIVRPNARFAREPALFRARLADKDWGERWPLLRFV